MDRRGDSFARRFDPPNRHNALPSCVHAQDSGRRGAKADLAHPDTLGALTMKAVPRRGTRSADFGSIGKIKGIGRERH
jgi:hypothetical protein